MAVIFFVTKNGLPVQGASVYYRKESGVDGNWKTDANGFAEFAIPPGQTKCIRINGIDQDHRYLRKGVNEFKI